MGHYAAYDCHNSQEINEELRSLHHLKEEHLWQDNFQSMNVGYALRILNF